MVSAVSSFGRKASGAEVALFFYAGHGMQVNGANYLIPVGASVESSADVEFEAMKANRILAQMENADAKVNLVILDACRDNPFQSFRSASRGLAMVRAVSGSVIVYATAPGDVAADGKGRNSPFTRDLLKHIATPGLTVKGVFNKTGAGVSRATKGRQSPWINSSLYEDFYLVAEGSTYGAPVSQPSNMGSLRLESEPSGAQIFLNGNRIGRTPKIVDGLPTGRVTVEARMDGYESQKKIISVSGGRSAHVGFALSEVFSDGKNDGERQVQVDYDEAQVRYRLADSQLGGAIGFYRRHKDATSVEACNRWDAGGRVVNIKQFQRKVVQGKGWQIVIRGTEKESAEWTWFLHQTTVRQRPIHLAPRTPTRPRA